MHSPTQAAPFPRRVYPSAHSRLYRPWLAGAVLLATLSIFGSQNITQTEFVYAGVLLSIAIRAYVSWTRASNIRIPVWALVCGSHFVFYGLAVFGPERRSPSTFDYGRNLSDSAIDTAMLVGLVGLLSIWIGRMAAVHFAMRKTFQLPFLEMGTHTPVRIQALLLLGTAANLFGVPFFGTVVWNISVVAFSTLPLAAFLWLLLARRVRRLTKLDFLLGIAFLVTRLISGPRFHASLGTVVVPLFLTGLAYVFPKRKLPWGTIAVVACVIVFLQPSKGVIRKELNRGEVGEGLSDAMVRWSEVAASGWSNVFSGRAPLDEQLRATGSRSSLLTMTGLILEKTPEVVPYQLGASYPLLLRNLIPRVLWPEKPSVSLANQFFQVKYGLTERGSLASVSIACGFEAEGYMNFGWLGILAVGLLVGFALGLYEVAFFSIGTGLTATAVGLALLPGFLTIESQLVQYLGGILQFAFAASIVFHRTKGKRPSYGGPGAVQRGRFPSAFANR